MTTSDTAGPFAAEYIRRATAVLAARRGVAPETLRDVSVNSEAAGDSSDSRGLETWVAIEGVGESGRIITTQFDTLPEFIAALDAVEEATP